MAKLAGLAVTACNPRFRFTNQVQRCRRPATCGVRRVVAERATVSNPPGQWQLQAQVLHWRGDTWLGGQLAQETFDAAVSALRASPGHQRSRLALAGRRPLLVPAAAVSRPVIPHEYRSPTGERQASPEFVAVVGRPGADPVADGPATPPCSMRSAGRSAPPTSTPRPDHPGRIIDARSRRHQRRRRLRVARHGRSPCPGSCHRDAEVRDPRPAGQAIVGRWAASATPASRMSGRQTIRARGR